MSDAFGGKIEIPRKTMVLFFIIDTSGSMEGAKIGAVNQAIREVLPEIKDMSDENADAMIKIALSFSSGSEWITPGGPVDAGALTWSNLDAAGPTDLGHACRALADKLSVSKGFMKEAAGSYAPALFLLSDGDPTDDWKSGLDKLKENNWYKAAVKVAIAIGEDANKDVLKEFTGSKETVIEVRNSAMLLKMIKTVSVTASQVASQGAKSTDPTKDPNEVKQVELGNTLQTIQVEAAAAPDAGDPEW